MAEAPLFLAKKRYAVVTGANKGIGLEVCRQLASQGVGVVVTSRDEKRGIEAIYNLKESGVNPENLEFHQLDVTDPISIASLADFVKAKFGLLDILVNNAGIIGAQVDFDALVAADFIRAGEKINYKEKITQTYEMAAECLKTNYYGVKRTIEALLPLLQLSDSPRIINVSSGAGKLNRIPSEKIRGILGNIDDLTEEAVDEILKELLENFKDGSLPEKKWPSFCTAYSVSKAALNGYTRILAKKHPLINFTCVCPGYVKTDINGNTGNLPVEEGGTSVVRLALMPHGSPSGLFFLRNEPSSF